MNKKLPYEEALERQLGNMPLPGEDAAWQRMQELLDEKKKRRPFLFFSTYTGKSVLTLLVVLGFLVVMHATRQENNSPAFAQKGSPTPSQNLSSNPAVRTPVANEPVASANRAALKPQKLAESSVTAGRPPQSPSLTLTQPAAGSGPSSVKKTRALAGEAVQHAPDKAFFSTGAARKKYMGNHRELVTGHSHVLPYKAAVAMAVDIRYAFISSNVKNHVDAPPVALNQIAKDPPAATQLSLPAAASDLKKMTGSNELSGRSHASLFVQTGIGVQQQIPVGGQKSNAFNLNGNRNLLSDYIPSLFLRLEKERRWFVQAEFSYASPQLVKDFSYSRQTLSDSAFRTVTTNLLLKKIFYHELPLNFNYYLRPNWSAGVGATYSWFYGAVTEKETATKNLQTQSGTVAKQIIPIGHYTDSFLYRSHTYMLVQTNYQWQNGSAGLRFSKDVQPYIKYTQPDGTVIDRRNWSLELLVRLGLWRSKKF